MKLFTGKRIVDGIVFGKTFIYKKNNIQIQKVYIENVQKEILRLDNAIYEIKEELEIAYNDALKDYSQDEADIFNVQKTLLEDEDYIISIKDFIKYEQVNSEFAILKVTENLIQEFSKIADDYIK